MLTDVGDVVVDPFAGNCVTGQAAEHLDRKWVCVGLLDEYREGALGRFAREREEVYAADNGKPLAVDEDGAYHRVPRPGLLWNGHHGPALPGDGGEKQEIASKAAEPKPDERSERSSRVGAAAWRRSG
jgi:hypothetical protein